MSEQTAESMTHDDQSHYEISLTAGQAFVAFVLLLLSLAASFAFGLMIGKGQADERLVVRKEPSVITEGSVLPKKSEQGGRIVELGVPEDDFKSTEPAAPVTETTTDAPAAIVTEEPAAATTSAAPAPAPPATATVAPATTEPAATPVYAQLLSTGDQKTAEALAVRLINGGFTSAYVVRGTSDKGPIFRVRVKFGNEAEAQAAERKLKAYSREVWITKQ